MIYAQPTPKVEVGPGEESPLKFPRDYHKRRRLFVEESFQHPARTNLNLLLWLIDRYTRAGQTILDPMGGTGSLLIGATVGRKVIVGDLEPHWVEIAKANITRIHTAWLFTEEMQVYQGDAANLDFATGAISHIITSPPYWDTFSDWHITSRGLQGEDGPYGQAFGDDRGRLSEERRQIGNIHIYELYLRAMMDVWRECQRVLADDGLLIAIVKDRVHKRRLVPIVEDTAMLLRAIGLQLVDRHDIAWPLSRYRNILRIQQPDAPAIETETVWVFQRPIRLRPPAGEAAKRCLALVTRPKPGYSPGSAPVKLFEKSQAHAKAQGATVHLLDDAKAESKAVERRQWCFGLIRELVAKGALGAGDEIMLYVPERYAPYLRQRLETLGCLVTEPLQGLNMGQKLARLTQEGF